ncbi:hypothetical protein [Comamonas serinivorans]|uniref:hypothetical protein n=1 Tax=Comamonas serinivorans TaxID=1082851 RepID=UPI0012F8F034|nr:hypothetical protein [Comamonas serinivorans]
MQGQIMALAKIIKAPTTGRGYFITTTKNTAIPQRETLEEGIVNLVTALGAEVIHKQLGSRGAYFYEVQGSGFSGFQSASTPFLSCPAGSPVAAGPNNSFKPTPLRGAA